VTTENKTTSVTTYWN